MVLERRAFRSEAGVDLIGQTYVKPARSFDPAENSGSQETPRWSKPDSKGARHPSHGASKTICVIETQPGSGEQT
jgi:hypothetical protein